MMVTVTSKYAVLNTMFMRMLYRVNGVESRANTLRNEIKQPQEARGGSFRYMQERGTSMTSVCCNKVSRRCMRRSAFQYFS